MKSLSAELDATKTDVINIEKYLAGYDQELAIYNGDFTAEWLLSDIHSNVWEIKTAKTINKDGKYKYIRTINWHRMMANGTYLDAYENNNVKIFYQKVLFILIENFFFMRHAFSQPPQTPHSQYVHVMLSYSAIKFSIRQVLTDGGYCFTVCSAFTKEFVLQCCEELLGSLSCSRIGALYLVVEQ